ncbi:MAG: hypothetical protein IRZ16_21320 [Myxococcaceae bacterium]|nr:hypothetical protein [Myxococcaceae bacterium]
MSTATTESDAQCSGAAPICDVARGQCVGCLSSADCAGGEVCRNVECGA